MSDPLHECSGPVGQCGDEEKALGFDPDKTFEVADEVIAHTRKVVKRGAQAHKQWQAQYDEWTQRTPEGKKLLDRLIGRDLPASWAVQFVEVPRTTSLPAIGEHPSHWFWTRREPVKAGLLFRTLRAPSGIPWQVRPHAPPGIRTARNRTAMNDRPPSDSTVASGPPTELGQDTQLPPSTTSGAESAFVVESGVERLVADWESSGSPAELTEYLPDTAAIRRAALIELIKVDLEYLSLIHI